LPIALPDPFAPAQIAGYAACVLGVTAFLQRNDRRLKLMTCVQAAAYALHYALLGNLGAAGSAGVSSVRSAAAAYSRSPWLAALFVSLNIGIGGFLAEGIPGWLPVIGNSIGTLALFFLHGIAMRATLLSATAMILTTNILSGSIGGTVLEIFIATANTITIFRLSRLRRATAT